METLTISSLPENIRMIESFIDRVKDQFSINDDLYGNIMIAVTEAVNNSIQHGNQKNATKNVILALSLKENAVFFRIEDEGNGFDYSTLPNPTAPENIGKIRGRGIFLMKNLSDEMKFSQGGKVVELTFYINE